MIFPAITLLLEYGGDINQKTREGKTPLHTALQTGYWQLLSFLLQRGADVNAVDLQDNTPLHILEIHKEEFWARNLEKALLKMVLVLLEYRPDLTVHNKNNISAFTIVKQLLNLSKMDLDNSSFSTHYKSQIELLRQAIIAKL